jgi:hypothetical protein
MSSVMSRSTAPAMPSFWPTMVVRNKYAEAETVAPAAITLLMKLRLETPG